MTALKKQCSFTWETVLCLGRNDCNKGETSCEIIVKVLPTNRATSIINTILIVHRRYITIIAQCLSHRHWFSIVSVVVIVADVVVTSDFVDLSIKIVAPSCE